ncbi:MAG: hypothetical protein KME27_29995 [Lyngbya sp. HA4199-MV5]|jgi:hypothetical protein|nr:hypothetical protein [Lyngbya sp. HA4199-MV5]
MAKVVAQADGTFLLAEKHCPICAIATACTGLCRMELEVFQAALGEVSPLNERNTSWQAIDGAFTAWRRCPDDSHQTQQRSGHRFGRSVRLRAFLL